LKRRQPSNLETIRNAEGIERRSLNEVKRALAHQIFKSSNLETASAIET